MLRFYQRLHSCRQFSRGFAAAATGEGKQSTEEVKEAFNQAYVAATSQDPPNIISDFYPTTMPENITPAPETISLSVFKPGTSIFEKKQVWSVVIPSAKGEYQVTPGSVPTAAEIRPGIMRIYEEQDKPPKRMFVVGGFAFTYEDSSAEICTSEAVDVEDIDHNAVKNALAEFTQRVNTAQGKGDDYEMAVAQIGLEVYTQMDFVLSSNYG